MKAILLLLAIYSLIIYQSRQVKPAITKPVLQQEKATRLKAIEKSILLLSSEVTESIKDHS